MTTQGCIEQITVNFNGNLKTTQGYINKKEVRVVKLTRTFSTSLNPAYSSVHLFEKHLGWREKFSRIGNIRRFFFPKMAIFAISEFPMQFPVSRRKIFPISGKNFLDENRKC
jgi:hypothetical protein